MTRSPLLFVVLLTGLFARGRRWRDPVPGYHALGRRQRAMIAVGYTALVAGLVARLAMAG